MHCITQDLIVTQTATYPVSRPRKTDCYDEQHDAARNTVERTCMNHVGSSQFLQMRYFTL